MKRTQQRFAAAVFAALAAFVCGAGAAEAQPANTIRYGVAFPKSIGLLPQTIAERQGYFAREGIKVERVLFADSDSGLINQNAMVAALKNHDVNMEMAQTPFFINDVLKGADFVAVASIGNPVFILVARPDIKTFADLKGKTVTLTAPIDGFTIGIRKVLERHGLKDGDYKIGAMEGSGSRLACMKAGQCVAAPVTMSDVAPALEAGFHVLGDTSEIKLLNDLETADRSWAKAHPELLTKYLRAIGAAMRYMHDPANHEAVVKVAMEITEKPETATRQVLTYYWDPKYYVLPRQGELDTARFMAVGDLLVQYGFTKTMPPVERFVDLTYAKAAGIQ